MEQPVYLDTLKKFSLLFIFNRKHLHEINTVFCPHVIQVGVKSFSQFISFLINLIFYAAGCVLLTFIYIDRK